MVDRTASALLDTVEAQVVPIRIFEVAERDYPLDALDITYLDIQARQPLALALEIRNSQEQAVLGRRCRSLRELQPTIRKELVFTDVGCRIDAIFQSQTSLVPPRSFIYVLYRYADGNAGEFQLDPSVLPSVSA